MIQSRKWAAGSSRRTFLKATASAAAGTVLTRNPLWGPEQSRRHRAGAAVSPAFPKFNPQFMITPDQAWGWNVFKSQYVAAFRHAESGTLDRARSALKDLASNISTWVVTGRQAKLNTLVDSQIAKLF